MRGSGKPLWRRPPAGWARGSGRRHTAARQRWFLSRGGCAARGYAGTRRRRFAGGPAGARRGRRHIPDSCAPG